ncbi:hypothetical protein MVLG_00831 [Microbotryum lychnidis-dioicae p1A1 Lamole]|uniref:SURF1-like protein n=2 Tax=Microbotryum TaxID=34416 RepID=U5H094_USTV1|nr:hypothetical protein MVLG_00831 [Microbotryum lychnidis-dioicae p1A1 Lamole]SGY79634.1 BQ5605_C008g05180 [Microbotryum silenes-dioicae]|eukprot:KDE09116.1 hypothetical protein MVLG_00831 [Microbotryum lychnidis-dioicae p1A1 Lamole]
MASLLRSTTKTPCPRPHQAWTTPRWSVVRPRPCSLLAQRFSSTQSHSTSTSRSRPFVWILGIMPVFTFGLGTWQLQRLQWKLDMIDRLETKLHQEPVGLPARIDPAAIPEFAYRKVIVKGKFDHEHEIELGPKTRDGELGYHVVTPLIRGEGQDTIMVNRGFVKRLRKETKDRPESLTEGTVQVVGMLRDQEKRNSFTPENSPEKGQWVFSDIAQMAQYTHAEPVLVDEIFMGHAGEAGTRVQDGIPVGREATITLRNQHLTYAITWYALSAATSILLFRLMRRPARMSAAQFRSQSKEF